jgi:hypothetical protein
MSEKLLITGTIGLTISIAALNGAARIAWQPRPIRVERD